MSASSVKNYALNLKERAYELSRCLSSEVYGGKWSDDVGASYLSYAESLTPLAEGFVGSAESLSKIENGLSSVNPTADKTKLGELRSAVNRL